MSEVNKPTVLKIQLLAVVGGVFLIALTLAAMGWVASVLLSLFLIMAMQDYFTGKITGLIFLPVPPLLFLFFPAASLGIFAPLFGLFLGLWAMLGILQKRVKSMDPEKTYFGFGDVLGVPFAVTLVQAFLPVLGPAAFAFCLLVTLPWSLRRKKVMLLPWLVPGVILAAVGGILVAGGVAGFGAAAVAMLTLVAVGGFL